MSGVKDKNRKSFLMRSRLAFRLPASFSSHNALWFLIFLLCGNTDILLRIRFVILAESAAETTPTLTVNRRSDKAPVYFVG